MTYRMNNQRGFAVVYGLVILVLATIAGTALLFITHKDRMQATDYTGMRNASQAAVAALRACEGQFLNDPDEALAILTKYKNDNTFEWMLGTAANADEEQKIALGSGADAPQYSARIVRYDDANSFVMLEGTGHLANGAKKKAYAAYQLGGLGLSNRPVDMSYGLFLGGQLVNCNDPIHIEGDVYLSGIGDWGPDNQHFNQAGKIFGNLKTASSSNILDFSQQLWITGNAFFQCGLMPKGVLTVDGLAGFTFTGGYKNWDVGMQLNDNAYFIAPSNLPAGRVNGISGKTVYYDSPITSDRFSGFNPKTPASQTAATIAANLGMTTNNEVGFGLNLPGSWGSGVVQDVAGVGSDHEVSAATVESYWTSKSDAGKLYQNEWLVMQLTHDVKITGGNFIRKAIWITGEYQLDGCENFYNCSDESNTLIIVNESGDISAMGPGNNCNFRGLIYVNTTCTWDMKYQFGSNSNFYGAIHHASQTTFNINSGNADSVRILFTHPLAQSAIQEIANTGIILAPGETAPAERTLILVDTKIRPTLLSMWL
ncbi:MAG: hypothetical protein JW913_03930 [Chitinispirillaceae bacterium]|nr:hypothetical protein [Chitinispirillaceae bacterium]